MISSLLRIRSVYFLLNTMIFILDKYAIIFLLQWNNASIPLAIK